MTSSDTGPYRPGGHWGVTIVREGTQPPDATGHRPDARLVAVVTDGDKGLAQVICGLLNTASGSAYRPAPAPEPDEALVCTTCGVKVIFMIGDAHHVTQRGFIDAALDKRHLPTPAPAGAIEPHGELTDPAASVYTALQNALNTALEGENYGVAAKVCELLEQVTRQVNREYRRQSRSSMRPQP